MSFVLSLLLSTTLATSPAMAPPAPHAVTAVPNELRQQLLAQVPPRAGGQAKLDRLVEFVFGDTGLALVYDPDSTRTVAETFRDRRANCVSATLLFVALARELGLDAQPQDMEQILSWQLRSDVLLSVGHANVVVDTGFRRYEIDIDNRPKLLREPPQRVSDARMLAHFYNNRGAELMLDGDPDAAHEHLQAALDQDPRFAPAWINLGVLRSRAGAAESAEQAYQHALQLNRRNTSTLFNLVALYQSTGNRAMESRYAKRLARARRTDPFYHYLLGHAAEQRGENEQAAEHYRRAIKFREREHFFHFGLARIYYRMGEPDAAAKALRRARELSDGGMRDRYQAKLDALKR